MYGYIATKPHFADFDSRIVSRYLATSTDVRPNLTTICIFVSPIGTGLLLNTPAFMYVDEFN